MVIAHSATTSADRPEVVLRDVAQVMVNKTLLPIGQTFIPLKLSIPDGTEKYGLA